MPVQRTISNAQPAPKPMPILPHEVVEMILQALELLISVEEEIDMTCPQWYAAAYVHEDFAVNQYILLRILNRHWNLISLVSRFWYNAINDHRLSLPFILKSSCVPVPVQKPELQRCKIFNKVIAEIASDHAFSGILILGQDRIESLNLFNACSTNVNYVPSPLAWESLCQITNLKELTINRSLMISLPSLFQILEHCRNLKALRIFLQDELSMEPELLIDGLEAKDQKQLKSNPLTCHISLPCYQFQSLTVMLKKLQPSLEMLTLVFEAIWPDMDHFEDEDDDIQDLSTDCLLETFRGCQNLKTLQISTPAQGASIPFVDGILHRFPNLAHLHLKGDSFSPVLFTSNLLPKTLKTLSCQAYSGPISTLLRAIRNSLSKQVNLESLTITTCRRKPRNFREAIYGELDLPHQTEELSMEELLLWDQCQAETTVEQKLLVKECELRAIKLDGPRPHRVSTC